MIISVVATKIWYLKNVQFLLGHPVNLLTSVQLHMMTADCERCLARTRTLDGTFSFNLCYGVH